MPDFVKGCPATARRIFAVSRSISRGSSPSRAGSRKFAMICVRRDRVLTAPDRRAGDFAQTGDAFIGVNFQNHERRLFMRAQAAANLELGANRHEYGNGFDR